MNLRSESREATPASGLLNTLMELKKACSQRTNHGDCNVCAFNSVSLNGTECTFNNGAPGSMDIQRFIGLYDTIHYICKNNIDVHEFIPEVDTVMIETRARAAATQMLRDVDDDRPRRRERSG